MDPDCRWGIVTAGLESLRGTLSGELGPGPTLFAKSWFGRCSPVAWKGWQPVKSNQ